MKKPTRVICSLLPAVLLMVSPAVVHGQFSSPKKGANNDASAAPKVIHVHTHYHYLNPGSPFAGPITAYQPSMAWHYGLQPGGTTFVRPWKQDWGHLGFTGFLGQHGGGADYTRETFTGLIVDTVTPGGAAAKMGLVPGDFILSINGQAVDNYKQVTLLFEQTQKNPKQPLKLVVWNPATRRKNTISVELDDDDDDE